jgi:hypothetical protein
MSLQAGTRFGTFEIVGPIGAGGMGEVYRARDTQLKRDVALKVLPAALAGDPGRLARFQREAELLAALNHAQIAHIYGLADHGGVRALVMELVEGRTLAELLTGAGAVDLPEAIGIARQIAEAFEYAHERGIIHRDLKPANVKITPDGAVKVLDFGLAKALSPDLAASGPERDAANTPTITTPAMTQAGIILGTAAYMSPEQARGKPVDSRADVWAFGVVLFEMLTGRTAFPGETITDVLGAIVHKEPDWNTLPPSPSLGKLIRRCLERDPKRRLRDIGEARIVLEDLASGRSEAAEAVPQPATAPAGSAARRPSWRWFVAVAGAAAIGLAVGAMLLAPQRPTGPVVRFEIAMNAVSSAVISPDGRQLVIAAQDRLWIRDLSRLETREIAGTDGAIRPFWSRDSRTIAYGARGKLWRVAADAGTPSVICDLASGLWDDDAGGAWMADDTIVFSNGNAGLWQVAAQGGDPVEVLKPDPERELHFHNLSGLPDGRSVIYVVHRAGEGVGTNTLSVWSAGQARVLHESQGQSLDDPYYSPSGHIVFQRVPLNAGVWALPFSASSLEVMGEPFLVSAGVRGPSVSADGTLVLVPPRRRRPLNLVMAGRDGSVLSRIDEPRFRQAAGVISPDGNRVAVAEAAEGGADLWLYDLRRGTRSRLTTNDQAMTPAWMPDGRSLLYEGRATSGQGFATKRVTADGSGRVEEIGPGRHPAVSSDGTLVFYSLPDQDGIRLWYRSLTDANAEPRRFVDQAFYFIAGVPSPDGQFVAYQAESGVDRSEVYLRRFPPGEGVWQVSANGGTFPRWSRDGRLFFAQGADIFGVSVTTGAEVQLGTPERLFTRTAPGGGVPAAFDVSPDGTRFLIYEPAGDTTQEKLVVVQHWFAEFDR